MTFFIKKCENLIGVPLTGAYSLDKIISVRNVVTASTLYIELTTGQLNHLIPYSYGEIINLDHFPFKHELKIGQKYEDRMGMQYTLDNILPTHSGNHITLKNSNGIIHFVDEHDLYMFYAFLSGDKKNIATKKEFRTTLRSLERSLGRKIV